MRINHGHAATGPDVVDDHVFQNRGLTHAGFPNQIHVAATVVSLDAEFFKFVAVSGLRENGDITTHSFIALTWPNSL